jgi:hypothetical protein
MIAERDAAILERNSAIAERTAAYAERDAALLLRDVAYADRDSAMEERDAAVAALQMALGNRSLSEKRSLGKDSKLFQTLSMKRNCAILGAVLPAPLSSTRFSSVVEEQIGHCRSEVTKELVGGYPRKRKLLVKSTHDRALIAKKPCHPPEEYRFQLGDGEADNCKSSNQAGHVGNVRYPIPHCSCTGVRQQCYRWGNGGWQSSCCTTMISMYPLPMNPTKRGSRFAGRKMSAGAFEKLLKALGSKGININHPVDLKDHWAKHGTNRYVTLR